MPTSIVKVQLARGVLPVVVHPDRIERKGEVGPAPEGPHALIYDEQRLHMEQRKLGKRDLKLMGKELTVYRQAKWDCKKGKWDLRDRVVSQSW